MNNNYVFFEGEEYLIEDGNISKIINGELEMPSKREIEDIEDYLEQNVFFASKELNDIALNNPELIKCDILIDVINTLDNFILSNVKDNFYTNLKTLKVNIGSECGDEYTNPCYDATDNILLIPSAKLEKLKDDAKGYNNSKEVYIAFLVHVLLHEMLHISSTDREKVLQEDYYLHSYYFFKEGMTESITAMLSNTSDAYILESKAIKQLSMLIPFEIIIETYFKDLGIDNLTSELNKIILDDEKAESIFYNLELGCSKCIGNIQEKVKSLLNAQNDLLDYIDKKCLELKDDNQYDYIKNVLDMLNKNYLGLDELFSLKIKSNNPILINNDNKLKELNNKYNKQKQLTI